MRLFRNKYLLILLALILLFAVACGDDDDDDTQADDDLTDDDQADDDQVDDDVVDDDAVDDDAVDDDAADDDTAPLCDAAALCERLIGECAVPVEENECLAVYEDPEACYDRPANLACACVCYLLPTCSEFVPCLQDCLDQNCPDVADLPAEPPIPGIPGVLDDLPPAVDITVEEEQGGLFISGGGLTIEVTWDPFAFSIVRDEDGATILQTGAAKNDDGFAPLALTRDRGFYWNSFYWGYRGYLHREQPWSGASRVIRYWHQGDRLWFDVRDEQTRGRVLFVVGPFYQSGVRLSATAAPNEEGDVINRLAFTFTSPPDERYVGFGERWNSIDQRGKVVESWSEEGGIEPGSLRPLLERLLPEVTPEWSLPGGEDASYAPVPFFLSNYGYGLLADAAHPTHFDLAATHGDLWQVKVETGELSLIVFGGPTPADALAQYTERTGRSLVPRHWVFGPWNMFHGYGSGSLQDWGEELRHRDIPSSVTHVWTDITPGGGYRGNEPQIIAGNELWHQLGYKALCYLNCRVDYDRLPDWWAEADALGLFTKTKDGDSYIQQVLVNLVHQIIYNISLIDFSHPDADDWWHGILQIPIDLGFDGFMYDFGEYTPPDSYFSDGRDGDYWHNPYPLIYQRSGHRFFRQLDDDPDDGLAPDYVYFHRSGYAGSQQWAYATWGGDPEADWSVSDGLPAQVCGGVNLGLSGLPFWGSDTGGFHAILVPAPTSELHKRWVQFSAFSGLMRDITADEFTSGSRIHILDEPELTYIVRRYQKLRTQLVPYIVNAAWEYRETGLPLMRAPLLQFPDDPAVWNIKREFLFGPDLYVAPVIEEGATTRTLYLPPGQWVELWALSEYDGDVSGAGSGGIRLGGEVIEGGREITIDAPVDEIPIFVRLGAIIPLVDPAVDTWSPADPPPGVDITTAADLAHLLHVWAFPHGQSATTLADESLLEVTVTADGVELARTAVPDAAELVAQIVWPADMNEPAEIPGLTFVPDADPLALDPGEWTWSAARNAAAFHGQPGQNEFQILRSMR